MITLSSILSNLKNAQKYSLFITNNQSYIHSNLSIYHQVEYNMHIYIFFQAYKMIKKSPIQTKRVDKEDCLIKRLTKQILDKIKQEHKDIDLSFTDIDYFDPSIVQGNNFIAKFSHFQNSEKNNFAQRMNIRQSKNVLGGPYGVGLYFQEKQENNQKYFDVTIGEIINGKCQGPGIRMQIYLKFHENQEKDPNASQQIKNSRPAPKITTQKHRVLYLEDWSLVDPLIDRIRQGIYYYKDGLQQQTFKGLFVNQQIYSKGKLTIKHNGQIKSVYKGNFNQKNQAHGYGQFLIPGKYQYKGEYYHNKKHGFGQENDFCQRNRYVGDFYEDQREGYGEFVFEETVGKKKENNSQDQGKQEKKKNWKLKGYWKGGVAIGRKSGISNEKQNASEILQSQIDPGNQILKL